MSNYKTNRGVTYRLLPGSSTKASVLAGQAGACRYVWNHFLAKNRFAMQCHRFCPEICSRPSTSFFSLGKEFTNLRREVDWLKDYSAFITRYTLKRQSDAWNRKFKGIGGFPKFKSKHGSDPSFTIPENVRTRDGRIFIPKIGWLRIRRKGGNPYPDGRPVSATVRRVAGKWYVSVNYEVLLPEPVNNGITAGVDRNVGQVAVVDSSGNEEIHYLPDLSVKEARRKRYQRKLARQVKGSNRRDRTRLRLQKVNRNIANIRSNWNHQVSRKVADQAGVVVIEDLNTSGITKSAKGTIENPGKNVSQKAGLNREILNTGWSQLENYLGYKTEIVRVSPAYTSQKCSVCGHVSKENRKSQSAFRCVACGHAENADLNAARNILASGIGASARGGAFSLETPLIRERMVEVA